ncbi:DUF7305 domain-containing protein [Marinospirillum insulare]|nr:hypothetical protein [Marinospirillum insulare]
MYTVEAHAKRTNLSDKNNQTAVCNDVYDELNTKLKGVANNFQSSSAKNADVYWKLANLNQKCGDDEIAVELVAWQGKETAPIIKLIGKGRLEINQIGGGGGTASEPGEEVQQNGVTSNLQKIMGNNVATSSGTIKASLIGARIEGNVKAKNKIRTSWFGRIRGDKREIDKTITSDPLELAKFIDESEFYIDENKIDSKKIAKLNKTKFKFKSSSRLFDRNIGIYPITRGVITPQGLTVYDAKERKDIEVDFPFYEPVDASFLGRVACCDAKKNPGCNESCPAKKLAVLDQLTINRGGIWINGDKPTLRISGGDVILYVKGDVWLGGFSKLHIDNDSSLTLIVDGTFTQSGLFEFTNRNITNNRGAPLFTLLSNGGNRNILKAVNIMGIRPIYGMIYAVSDITVSGSGDIQGQVFGNNVTATLGGSIRYKEFGKASDDATGNFDDPPDGGNSEDESGEGGSGYTPQLDINFEIIY